MNYIKRITLYELYNKNMSDIDSKYYFRYSKNLFY